MESSAEIALPIMTNPYMDCELPNLAIDRNDNAEPTVMKSSTEKLEPH